MSLVSVIMPYFKKRQYIEEALQSILNQTYQNFEIIIINDEVTADSQFILENLTKIDFRIKLINNQNNLGAGPSRNKGIKIAKGDYIAFCDCDDFWKKTKLKTQLDFMKNYQTDFSFTAYDIVDKEGNKIGARFADKEMTFKKLVDSCDIGLSTVVLKSSLLKKKNLNFPQLKTKEDYVLWLNLANEGVKMFGLNESLSSWRKSNISLSSSSLQKIFDGYKVYRYYLRFSILKSLYSLFILSMNFLIKK